jgi:opacity protein-like surface antigen
MRALYCAATLLVFAAPLSAQSASVDLTPSADQTHRPIVIRRREPALSLRGFALYSVQDFAATQSFEGIFGSSIGPFVGGGGQVVSRTGIFAEVSGSRFHKTGERAFLSDNRMFRLGIPLTVNLRAIEVLGGYRFRFGNGNIVPYGGAGVGSFKYDETSERSDPGEDFSANHTGFVAVGGVEVRVMRWIWVSADAHVTHVTGILGSGGISKDANEDDAGGLAARFRVLVGW